MHGSLPISTRVPISAGSDETSNCIIEKISNIRSRIECAGICQRTPECSLFSHVLTKCTLFRPNDFTTYCVFLSFDNSAYYYKMLSTLNLGCD